MKREKEYTEGIAARGGFLGWLDNYWYHYKWPTIIGAFFLIVVIICTVQACSKDDYDLTVVYAGREALTSTEREGIRAALCAYAPEKSNGKGKANVGFNAYNIMSKEQITEEKQQTDENGNPVFVDNSFYTNEYNTYSDYINTGECAILLLEGWEYDKLAETGRLLSFGEALGYTPEGAISDYAVRLGDTEIYAKYDVMKNLPEDTVVCLMRPLVWGRSRKSENYETDKQMFASVVKIKAEVEGETE